MADSDIVMKNLTKARLRRLLNMFCVHAIEFKMGHFVCHWEKCNACILRDIPYNVEHGFCKTGHVKRNLCFAVWHEDILNA